MDSTTIKRAKPATTTTTKKYCEFQWIPSYLCLSVIFLLFISTRIYENRVSHLPCLSLFTVLFAYVASFISCFVVRDLCSISRRFRVLSNPHLPPSLARGCFFAPVRNLLSWTKVTVIWNQKPKAGFGAVPQFKLRYWSPRENFPGEHHVKLWDGTKLIRFADII